MSIAATGALSTFLMLGQVADLFGPYGRLIIVKVGLFLLMLLVAAYNRLRLLPILAADSTGSSRPLRRLRHSIFVEQGLGMLVLLLASTLGITDPS